MQPLLALHAELGAEEEAGMRVDQQQRAAVAGQRRLERHRHRAAADPRRPRAAADQPAHQLLLPLRTADDERRRAQRLWRLHLGPVLHLSGLQRAGRLDAHVERHRQWSTSSPRPSSGAAIASSTATAARCARSRSDTIAIRVRQPDGSLATRSFTTYATHHGPIVRADGERWIAMALMHRPVEALQQSWLRTKARDFAGYMRVAALQANSAPTTPSMPMPTAISPISIPSSCRSATTASTIATRSTAAIPATDWRGLTPLDRPADGPRSAHPLALQRQ